MRLVVHNPLNDELEARASCAVIGARIPQQRTPIWHSGAVTLCRSGELWLTLGERVVAAEPPIRFGEVLVCQHSLKTDARADEAFV